MKLDNNEDNKCKETDSSMLSSLADYFYLWSDKINVREAKL